VILGQLMPKIRDVTDLWAVVRYNLGLSRERPTFAMFNYAEKVEYWAFVWGTVVMTVSGLLLWFVNFTLRYFPKWFTDAATAVHFYEAVLATLAILLWHFYFVIFDPDVYPMDRTWLTGKTSAVHLRETRPQYYLAIVSEAGPAESQNEAPGTAVTSGIPTSESAEGKPGLGNEVEPNPPKDGKA
jgi:cytochrome b subunit of formate dehydrogenase